MFRVEGTDFATAHGAFPELKESWCAWSTSPVEQGQYQTHFTDKENEGQLLNFLCLICQPKVGTCHLLLEGFNHELLQLLTFNTP